MKDRRRIDACRICDHNGMAIVLPETDRAWETLARCPHNAHELLDIKRHADRRSLHAPEPDHAFSEPIHQHDDEPMF
jgi:hypothetical protein